MRQVQLQQGTREWHQWRDGGLGGSDASIIMGVCAYEDCTIERLLAQKCGEPVPERSSFAMRRGSMMEPIARERYYRQTGMRAVPICAEHDSASWCRASLDGWWPPIALEIKCPNHYVHAVALEGIVPKEYEPQLAHVALVTGAKLIHYCSFNDGKRFTPDQQMAIVPYTPTAEYLGELLEREEAFWQRVLHRRRMLGK